MKNLISFLTEANAKSTPENTDPIKGVAESIKSGKDCGIVTKDFRKAEQIIFKAAKSNGYLILTVLCDKMEPSDMVPIKVDGDLVCNTWASPIVNNQDQKFVLFLDLTNTPDKTLNALMPVIIEKEIQQGINCKNFIVCALTDNEENLPKAVVSRLKPIYNIDK